MVSTILVHVFMEKGKALFLPYLLASRTR
jgi:hypothetical protein